ncbi:MAG: hypothetical protein Q4F84_10110 [Fibrobacter sp.]|nr:hypothetical protein [Fibrobacter sp.]
MGSKHCRLYDENLVHSIILSTGLSVFEYYKNNGEIDIEEICEYLDANANSIIEDTIEQLNSRDSAKSPPDEGRLPEEENDGDSWSSFQDPENDL